MTTMHEEQLAQELEAACQGSRQIQVLFQEEGAKATATRLMSLYESGMVELDSETYIVLQGVCNHGGWMFPAHRRVAMSLTDKFMPWLFSKLLANSIAEIDVRS